MGHKFLFSLLLATIVSPLSASTTAPDASFDAYYDGNRYEFVIRHDLVERAQSWNPDLAPNPPLSAAAALLKSRACISSVATSPGTEWKFQAIGLANEAGGWLWISRYKLERLDGVMTGVWPTMFCAILMDGAVVKPSITKQKT